MVTIVNTPTSEREVVRESDSGTGLLVGVIIALILIALFFIYGLPAIRDRATPATTPNSASVNVTLPSSGSSGNTGGSSGGTGY